MTIKRPRIILVDDDPGIRQLLSEFLESQGFALSVAANAEEMDAELRKASADLVLLDLMLPGEDGNSICRRLSSTGQMPIIMLTAKNDEVDRILGLELGADDYVAKPFAPRELLARIRAVLRRSATPQIEQGHRRYAFEGLIIDLDARELLSADGESIVLTSGEFDLLSCFVRRARRVLTRDLILNDLKGREADSYDRSVDMLVSRLRRKLYQASGQDSLINTVRNVGYLFTPIVKEQP